MTWIENNIDKEEWVHPFIHMLDNVPTNWYIQQQLRCATVAWPRLVEDSLDIIKFDFEENLVDYALQWMKDIIFA